MLNLLVAHPELTQMMRALAHIFGSYGMAIVVVTLLVRLVITPLTLKANRERMIQQYKLAFIKPRVNQKIHDKAATTVTKQKEKYDHEIVELYKRNHIHLLFRPYIIANAVIQWPVLTLMYLAIRDTPAVNASTFNWGALGTLPLGVPNYLLFGFVLVLYLGEATVLLFSMPKSQSEGLRALLFVPALLISLFTFVSPAGLQLYFIVSGLVGCLIGGYSLKHRRQYRNEARKSLK